MKHRRRLPDRNGTERKPNLGRDTGAEPRTGRRATWAAPGRLPFSPLNDNYLVPEAPQSRVVLEYRLPCVCVTGRRDVARPAPRGRRADTRTS
eukprot:6009013-Prymnesium_polylepis.1